MIFNYNFIHPILLISKKYSIPSDISHIIYKFFINNSAQIIINKWYSHIMIHNINLIYLISKLDVFVLYDFHNHPFFYYDLNDKSVGIIFNICYKYFSPSLSSFNWWSSLLQYAFNGLRQFSNFTSYTFLMNYNSIYRFYLKLHTI